MNVFERVAVALVFRTRSGSTALLGTGALLGAAALLGSAALLVSAALLGATALLGAKAHAAIELPQVFANHMVLQADHRLPIWGTASPGERVNVFLGSEEKTDLAGATGNWRVEFPPRQATSRPTTVRASGRDTEIVLTDVLVGEVWLCAGQSNMEWPLKQAARGPQEVAAADHPQIRLLNLVGTARGGSGSYTAEQLERMTPLSFCRGTWLDCTPESAATFSAVGYYFGRKLHQELGVPIGLISPAIGGTPAEAWIRRTAIEADHQLARLVEGDWLENPQLDPWCQQRATDNLRRAREAGEEIPGDDLGPHHSFKPAFMWAAGVQPLVPYALRGVLWYQGESNAATQWRAQQHRQLFPLLVRDWRQQWGQGDFPFLFVQLPALGRPHWPLFREGQRRMLDALPNMGMAVTIDVGHPTHVHPVDKRPVGERLASWALAETYGRTAVASGPLFRSIDLAGGRAVVEFKYAEGGLTTSDRQAPVGFEVAGEDRRYFAAEARIAGAAIVVSSSSVPVIAQVRYGWAAYPDPPLNLVNLEGLPASPFSTADSLGPPQQ